MTDAGAAVPAASRSSETGDAIASASTVRDSAVLWAEALQALANVVAHDLRNALNSVAVNLEVVRGRSARGAEASAIAPFAATAASNFEMAAAAAESLLSLARPESGRVDVAALVARIARLVAVGKPSKLDVTDRSDGRASTDAPAYIVRATVARSVLAALDTGDEAACEITVDDGIFLRVSGSTRVPSMPDSELVAVALAHGIRIDSRGPALELRFPSVDQRATPHVPS